VAETPTRILSLFSGIGGLDLGFRAAFPRSRVVAYVEREAYCCEVLVRRMEEGRLGPAPVFAGDIRSFPARRFRGLIDTVVGGFPCPPVSTAGRRLGVHDDRWLWPEVVRVARESGAEWVAVENVPGLVVANSGRAFGSILGDLSALGFDAEWVSVAAADVGAPHERERVFLLARRRKVGLGLAESDRDLRPGLRQAGEPGAEAEEAAGPEPRSGSGELADPGRLDDDPQQPLGLGGGGGEAPAGFEGGPVADAPDLGQWRDSGREGSGPIAYSRELREGATLPPSRCPAPGSWPPRPDDLGAWEVIIRTHPELLPRSIESRLRGVADGLPHRVDGSTRNDRLRALGNAVVPAQSELAFRILWERLMEADQ
jgi:DNA (cytosine-5)-methyltransferase 1